MLRLNEFTPQQQELLELMQRQQLSNAGSIACRRACHEAVGAAGGLEMHQPELPVAPKCQLLHMLSSSSPSSLRDHVASELRRRMPSRGHRKGGGRCDHLWTVLPQQQQTPPFEEELFPPVALQWKVHSGG